MAGAITTPGETVSSEGIFAIVSISATGTATGISPLDLSNVIVGDKEGNAVVMQIRDGSVTVDTPTPVPALEGPAIVTLGALFVALLGCVDICFIMEIC